MSSEQARQGRGRVVKGSQFVSSSKALKCQLEEFIY